MTAKARSLRSTLTTMSIANTISSHPTKCPADLSWRVVSNTRLEPAASLDVAIRKGDIPLVMECIASGARLTSATPIVDALLAGEDISVWLEGMLQPSCVRDLFELDDLDDVPTMETVMRELVVRAALELNVEALELAEEFRIYPSRNNIARGILTEGVTVDRVMDMSEYILQSPALGVKFWKQVCRKYKSIM